MKATKYALVAVLLICCIIWSQNTAAGRVHVHISIGSPGIYAYPDYWWGCYPYYSWHRDYWNRRWLDRHPYRGPYLLGWPDYYWSGHRLPSSGLSISSSRLDIGCWIPDSYRKTESRIKNPESRIQAVTKPQDVSNTVEYFIQLRRKKSELIEKARTGHKENREEAIIELSGYSLDTRVRETLEEVLQSDPDRQLRKQAARSISAARNRKALPALEKTRAQDPDSEVRIEADKAIRKINAR